ncbi:MAG: CBS domain-containing protein [Gemmatimonadota bacterium]
MRVRDTLRRKGGEVITITPDRTVLEAMRLLVEHNIGAVLVVSGEGILGILSERDVLRLGADDPSCLETALVGEVMTTDLVVGVPEDAIHYAAAIMTRNRIRHLPIVEEGELRGIVSIGDVVNAIRDQMEAENRYLRSYIQGGHHP